MNNFLDKHFSIVIAFVLFVLTLAAFVFDKEQSHTEVLKLILVGSFSSFTTLLVGKGGTRQEVSIDSDKTNVISENSIKS